MQKILETLYPEAKEIFAKYGLILNNDYSFSTTAYCIDGAFFKPYFFDKNRKIIINYYGNGFEVVGEVIIDKISADIKSVEFTNWKII